MILMVFNPYLINIDILRLAFLGIDRLNPLLELKQRLIILSKAVIHVTGNPMPIASISSAVIALVPLLILVDEVVRLLRRLRSLLWDLLRILPVRAAIFIVIVEGGPSCHFIHTLARFHQGITRKYSTILLSVPTYVLLQDFLPILAAYFNLPNSFHFRQFSII
jgi:hypothetical protein